jgi:hypothetical protein
MRRPLAHAASAFGEFKAAATAPMHPLPAGLFTPEPPGGHRRGSTSVAPSHPLPPQASSSPELFGDFVDLWSEMVEKGQHEELGYCPCKTRGDPPR